MVCEFSQTGIPLIQTEETLDQPGIHGRTRGLVLYFRGIFHRQFWQTTLFVLSIECAFDSARIGVAGTLQLLVILLLPETSAFALVTRLARCATAVSELH
jgi:hypothetical protein